MTAVQTSRFLWRHTATMTYLEPAAFLAYPHVQGAFTTRHGGGLGQSLNLSFARGERSTVLANRQAVLEALGLAQTTLYTVRQVHGNAVCVVDAQVVQHGCADMAADALVSALPDVTLGILVADCLPMILYTLDTPVIAVVHAGRMGTYYRIVQQVLAVMQQRFAVSPAQVYAVLGPAIGGCCYTLDERAVQPFREQCATWEQFFTPRRPGQWTMSLTAANEAQLRAAGVPESHIDTAALCTVCHCQHFYSHRAEGLSAGRCMAIASIRPYRKLSESL